MTRRHLATTAVTTVALLLLQAPAAHAHCDGLDGPVVNDARQALKTNKVERVLRWVRQQDEGQVRDAFRQARAVRQLGAQARALADRHFFETLVRIHRAGEGAPYTGLKPAGRDLDPAIIAADRAVASGSSKALDQRLAQALRKGMGTRFRQLRERRRLADQSVARGRAYVAAYVEYLHYVEGVHAAIAGGDHHGRARRE